MATYLLVWNPNKWEWTHLDACIASCRASGYYDGMSWTCTKKLRNGDRLFLIRLGAEPKGIMASGWAKSDWYLGPHYDQKAHSHKQTPHVDVRFDRILDPREVVFPLARLKTEVDSGVRWTPQSSGTQIESATAEKLEKAWDEFNMDLRVDSKPWFPQEVETGATYTEGAVRQITVNAYERSAEARRKCIERHGAICAVCNFVFADMYGSIGDGYIEVHHLEPIGNRKKAYRLDPVKDLRPVCSNCHAMLHHRTPPYSIEELRKIVQENGG